MKITLHFDKKGNRVDDGVSLTFYMDHGMVLLAEITKGVELYDPNNRPTGTNKHGVTYCFYHHYMAHSTDYKNRWLN